MKIFGDRLKELRKISGRTQQSLGRIFNVTKQTISNYEAGSSEPDFKGLLAIAAHFNVTPQYLLGYSDYTNPLHETLSGKDIFSDEVIKLLSTLEPHLKKMFGILICAEGFESFLSDFYLYYVRDNYNERTKLLGRYPDGPLDFDPEVLDAKYLQFFLNGHVEEMMKYLDKLKLEKESKA